MLEQWLPKLLIVYPNTKNNFVPFRLKTSDPSDDHLIPYIICSLQCIQWHHEKFDKMLIAQFLVLDSLTRWIWQTGRSIAQLSGGVEIAVVVVAMGQWSQQSNQQRCSPSFCQIWQRPPLSVPHKSSASSWSPSASSTSFSSSSSGASGSTP